MIHPRRESLKRPSGGRGTEGLYWSLHLFFTRGVTVPCISPPAQRGPCPLEEQAASIPFPPSGFTRSDLTLREPERELTHIHLNPENKISLAYLATSYIKRAPRVQEPHRSRHVGNACSLLTKHSENKLLFPQFYVCVHVFVPQYWQCECGCTSKSHFAVP